MRKWIGFVVLMFGLTTIAGLYFAFPPSFYLPHEKPILILPIESQYDLQSAIMPMGEKIYHPNAPSGHPGIDFGFNNIENPIPYIASMNGTVIKVKVYPNKEEKNLKEKMPFSINEADVVIQNGPYQTVYSELDGDSLPISIKVGAKLKQGDIVGYGNLTNGEKSGGLKREMIHWEFGSISPVIDRFCPLTYFTEESQFRIETIWANTVIPDMKTRYPKICNGDYDGKAEK